MSDAFLNKFSRMLDNFRTMFPGKWYYFWDKSPGMLESFKQYFPVMPGNFWKVLPWILENFVEHTYPESMLCIDYQEGNACQSDSGGPLVTKHAGDDGVTPGQNYEQIGVVS